MLAMFGRLEYVCGMYFKFCINNDFFLREIFSFGIVPYPGMSSSETMAAVQKGYQMEKPTLCPEEIYTIMKECWNLNPEKRPSFVDICKRINAIYKVSKPVSPEVKRPSSILVDKQEDVYN